MVTIMESRALRAEAYTTCGTATGKGSKIKERSLKITVKRNQPSETNEEITQKKEEDLPESKTQSKASEDKQIEKTQHHDFSLEIPDEFKYEGTIDDIEPIL